MCTDDITYHVFKIFVLPSTLSGCEVPFFASIMGAVVVVAVAVTVCAISSVFVCVLIDCVLTAAAKCLNH